MASPQLHHTLSSGPHMTGVQSHKVFLSFFKNIFIYLFLAALGLRCCMRAFSGWGELGLLFIAVHGLLTAVASLVAEHGL